MRPRQFDSDNAAFAYITSRLATTLPDALARSLAEQYVVRCQMADELNGWPHQSTAEVGDAVIGAPWWGPWTVRDEELRDLAKLAITLTAASTAWPMTPLPDLVEFVLSAACMIWRLRQCGVVVNQLQRDVLLALRRRQGLDFDALVTEASAFGTDWTARDVRHTLAELSAMRLPNGTVVRLVHEAADGSWSTDARVWEVPFGSG